MIDVASPPRVGRYDCIRQPDGKFTVRRVPLMGPLKAGKRSNKMDVDMAWLKRCVENHLRAYADGFRPPVHIYHHFDPNRIRVSEARPAGKLVVNEAAMAQFRGTPQPQLFGDLEDVPEDVVEEIRKGNLSYISVEVGNWEEPELDSVALLPDQAPHFKFPEITLRDESFSSGGRPSAAWVTSRFFSSTGESMSDHEYRADPEKQEAGGEKLVSDGLDREKEPTMRDVLTAIQALAAVMQVSAQAGAMAPPQAMPVEGGLAEGVAEGDVELEGEPDKPVAEKSESDEAKPAEPKPDEKEAELVGAGAGEREKFSAVNDLAERDARIAALEAKLEQQERTSKAKELASKAFASLAGYPINDKTHQAIEMFAAAGADTLKVFVDTFKATVQPDHPEHFAGYEESKGLQAPPEIVQFAAAAGIETDQAKKLHSEWQMAQKAGLEASFSSFAKERLTNGS